MFAKAWTNSRSRYINLERHYFRFFKILNTWPLCTNSVSSQRDGITGSTYVYLPPALARLSE